MCMFVSECVCVCDPVGTTIRLQQQQRQACPMRQIKVPLVGVMIGYK